jgi:hypothetical protein
MESVGLILGPVAFVREEPFAAPRVHISQYPIYRAFHDAGLISLDNERDLTQSSDPTDFFNLSQSGVQRVADVRAILPAADATVDTVSGQALVTFHVFRIGDRTVVSNEPVESSTGKYRMVMGTDKQETRARFVSVIKQSGLPSYESRRYRALFKYDPFDKKWTVIAMDVGPRDGDFTSEYVTNEVRALKLGK